MEKRCASAYEIYKTCKRFQEECIEENKSADCSPVQKRKRIRIKKKVTFHEDVQTFIQRSRSQSPKEEVPDHESLNLATKNHEANWLTNREKILKPQKSIQGKRNERSPFKKNLASCQRPFVGPSLESILEGIGKIADSRARADKLFEWLILPVSPSIFFSDVWEKKPALITRHNPGYYKGLFSTEVFHKILKENDVQYGVNLDVTSYNNGQRQTHNPPGRALPFSVWNYFKNGCSLRLLNPQAFSVTVWNVLSILQELFGSMAGANVYLTPAGTQGFAPHYDDIEAFIIQLEGKKHWRVYQPRMADEFLPQFSSPNFSQAEIGQPILEVVVEAGDLLYFPRGFIHQGDCLPDAHSLHITISSYQKNSWGSLLEKLLPAALQIAVEEDVEFREGLPLDYFSYMGVQNSEKADPRRQMFIDKVQRLIRKLSNFCPLDAAVDQKAKDYLHDCLPPVLTEEEKATSVFGASTRWENGHVKDLALRFKGKTKIRLLRRGIARLFSEGENIALYYSLDNSRVYHKEEPKSFEVNSEHCDSIEFLINSYPSFVTVDSLPCEKLVEKISIAKLLFAKGLLVTEEPCVCE
ncbi:ribosomal oxygenase 1 [Erpetoichthys calabaricus]|uniref:ribosomal oxygenase 1 n=1 Tax=Erpetoichthys calabaricus TaxID=27687 RepID=UPI00223435B4|nr:ribosomal oxygenase 1 [Erpetoichthys calabaricus]